MWSEYPVKTAAEPDGHEFWDTLRKTLERHSRQLRTLHFGTLQIRDKTHCDDSSWKPSMILLQTKVSKV